MPGRPWYKIGVASLKAELNLEDLEEVTARCRSAWVKVQAGEKVAAKLRADAGQQLVESFVDLFVNTTAALASSDFLTGAVERLAEKRPEVFAALIRACEATMFGPAGPSLDESVESFEASPSFATADQMVKVARQYVADEMLSQPSFDALMEKARRYLVANGRPL